MFVSPATFKASIEFKLFPFTFAKIPCFPINRPPKYERGIKSPEALIEPLSGTSGSIF